MNLNAQINTLQDKLRITGTSEEMGSWWDDFKIIESQVTMYGGAPNKKANTENLGRANRALSELMSAIRDGLPSPNLGAAIAALESLKRSFSKGTVGADGWPIK